MGFDYWNERWSLGQTGFDEKTVNGLLEKHVERLGKPKRVLVPLAGKAADLRWLADRGHDVVGVEFVQAAIDAFFAGEQVKPTPHRLGAHDAFYAKGVTLVRADMFDVRPETLPSFEVIYDRAALVALEPSTRDAYVKTCAAVVTGGTLLIAFSYPEGARTGPPYSVDEAEVRRLYAGRKVVLVESREVGLTESVYWIEP